MKPWRQLSKEENHALWDRFYTDYEFRPSVYAQDWPSIKTRLPQLKLDIMECFHEDYDQSCFDHLDKLAQKIFKEITTEGQNMYALNWQHDGYEFDPRQEYPMTSELKDWPVSLLPHGCYNLFTTQNFDNLWFSHPWEESITLVGNKMVLEAEILKEEFKKMRLLVMDN